MKTKHKLFTTFGITLSSMFLSSANAQNDWENSLPNAQSVSLQINLIPANAPSFTISGTPSFANDINLAQRYHGTTPVTLNYSNISANFVLHVYTRANDYVVSGVDNEALGVFLIQNGDYVITSQFNGQVNGQDTFKNWPVRIPLKVNVFDFENPSTGAVGEFPLSNQQEWDNGRWGWVFEQGMTVDPNDSNSAQLTGVAFVAPEAEGPNLTGSLRAKFGVDIQGAPSGIYERDVWFDIDLTP